MDRQALGQRVRSMYDAFAAGDTEAYRAAFADNIVWHVPGDNPVSGAYRGTAEYFGTMVERMSPLDEWSITVNDILTNERDMQRSWPFASPGPGRAGTWTWMGGT